MRTASLIIFFVFCLYLPAAAQKPQINEQQAKAFVQSVINDGIAMLSNDKLTITQQERSFRKLLEKNFAMKTIARFAIGKYWRQATPNQQEQYLKLFNDIIVHHYSSQFKDYSGKSADLVSITGVKESGKRDAMVVSVIPRKNGNLVTVEWRIRSINGNLRIVDIVIEGVSMAMTKRSEFSSIIQRKGGGVQSLLDELQASLNSGKSE